jgi:uncharacterized protein (TIGR04255 family)
VTEVVLSIQFAALPGLRAAHFGLYWNEIRGRYPKTSEQAPLAPVFETFGATPMLTPQFQIHTMAVPPFPRHWFETEDGEHLVQVQQQRILHNWRKRSPQMEYPRYEPIREEFLAEVEKLETLFRKESIGALQPNQCEVTYINTITLPDDLNPQKHLARITPLWAGNLSEQYLPEAETALIHTKYVLSNGNEPFGRIYVNFVPALRADDYRPVVHLEITARGKPADGTVAAGFALLDEERDMVVRTFTAVTTQEMHKEWGRTDVSK